MTPEQQEQRKLEQATWDTEVVSPGVKLYLLALIRTGDHELAAVHAGLSPADANVARGWLAHVGVVDPDGAVDATALEEVQKQRPVEPAAA